MPGEGPVSLATQAALARMAWWGVLWGPLQLSVPPDGPTPSLLGKPFIYVHYLSWWVQLLMKPPEKAEWEGTNSQACWNGLPHLTQRASLRPSGRSKKWIPVRLSLSWENQALHSWILPPRRSWWVVPGAEWVENKRIPMRKVGHSATPEVDVGHTSVCLSILGERDLDPHTSFIYPQSWQHPSVWTILDPDFGPALSLQ